MSQMQVDVCVANRFIASLSKSLQALCHGCMEFESGIEIIGYINLSIDRGGRVDYVLNEKVLKTAAKSMTFVSNSFLAKRERPEFVPDKSCSTSPETTEKTRNCCSPVDCPVEAKSNKTKEKEERDRHSRTSRYNSFKKSSQEIFESDSESLCVKHEIDVTGEDGDVLEDFCEWSVTVKQDPELSKLALSKSDNDFDIQSNASESLFQTSMPSTIRQDFAEFSCDREGRCQSDELSKERNSYGLQCEAENSNNYTAEDNQQLPSSEKDVDAINDDTLNIINKEKDKDVLDPQLVPRLAKMDDLSRCRPTSCESDQANVMQACLTSNWELGSNQRLPGQNHSVSRQKAPVCQRTKNSKIQHCLFCRQTFGSRLDYHKHLDQFHSSEMPFTCSLCGRGYLTATGLHRHAMVHAGKSYPCPVCSAPFNQKQNMKRHLGNIHRVCQCPVCLKTFSIMDGIYKEHVLGCHRKMDKPKSRLDYYKNLDQFHSSEMPFTCSLCGKGYLTATGLHHHAMVHAGKSYPCPVCSVPFNQKQNMKRHLGNIHRLCQCTVCLKTFSIMNGIYKEHILGCHKKMDKPKTRIK